MNSDSYLSICGRLLKLADVWGWESLEKKYNPNFRFSKVHIVCFNDTSGHASVTHGSLCIHRVPRPSIYFHRFPIVKTWILARYAKRIIERNNIPLAVHLYSNILSDGVPTVLAAKWTSIPSMVTLQNDYQQLLKTTSMYLRFYHLNRFMESYVYRNATHVRCISPYLVRYLVDHSVPKRKVSFVPRCFDLTTFRDPTASEKASFIEKYVLQDSKNGFVILCVAKFQPQKNLERTLQAFTNALNEIGPAQLIIAGHGKGKRETRLREQAKKLGVSNYVKFLGKIPQSDLRCAYATSDVFLLPSLFEGLGRAVIEALSYGLPVIVSNLPSLEGIVKHGYNGLLVDPFDVESIATTIIRLAKSKELRTELGDNARTEFREKYSFEECCERKAKLIMSLLDDRKSDARLAIS